MSKRIYTSTGSLLIQALMKYFILFCIVGYLYSNIQSAVDAICIAGTCTMKDHLNPMILLATISGLTLAGAVSGYFQFSFKNTWNHDGVTINNHQLLLGHFATGLNLIIISSLLVVAFTLLENYFNNNIGLYFKYLSITLFISMIVYDLYDLFTLEKN